MSLGHQPIWFLIEPPQVALHCVNKQKQSSQRPSSEYPPPTPDNLHSTVHFNGLNIHITHCRQRELMTHSPATLWPYMSPWGDFKLVFWCSHLTRLILCCGNEIMQRTALLCGISPTQPHCTSSLSTLKPVSLSSHGDLHQDLAF